MATLAMLALLQWAWVRQPPPAPSPEFPDPATSGKRRRMSLDQHRLDFPELDRNLLRLLGTPRMECFDSKAHDGGMPS